MCAEKDLHITDRYTQSWVAKLRGEEDGVM
mgnify:CR=1 FL=1